MEALAEPVTPSPGSPTTDMVRLGRSAMRSLDRYAWSRVTGGKGSYKKEEWGALTNHFRSGKGLVSSLIQNEVGSKGIQIQNGLPRAVCQELRT